MLNTVGKRSINDEIKQDDIENRNDVLIQNISNILLLLQIM